MPPPDRRRQDPRRTLILCALDAARVATRSDVSDRLRQDGPEAGDGQPQEDLARGQEIGDAGGAEHLQLASRASYAAGLSRRAACSSTALSHILVRASRRKRLDAIRRPPAAGRS